MKKLLLVFVIVFLGFTANAQLRHVAGSQSVGLGIGVTKEGKQISGNYGYLLKNDIGVGGRLAYEKLDFDLSDAGQIYFNPSGWYMLKKIKEMVFLNVKGGVLVGYEFTSNDILDKKENGIYFGQSFGLNAEFYVHNKITIDLNLEQRIFQKSMFGSNSYLISLIVNYKL